MKNDVSFGEAVTIFLMAIIVALLLVFPLMWLWNWLIPTIFNGPTLTFWETFGLYTLVRCFTGFHITSDSK